MGKVVVVIVFALAMCWIASNWINLSSTVFALAGIPVSVGMLFFGAGVFMCHKLVKG